MADYIRGKKSYTKWDVDADNVDIDIPLGAQRPQLLMDEGWFYGTKGKVLKILFFAAWFLIGLIIGYVWKKSGQELEKHGDMSCHPLPPDMFLYNQDLQDSIAPGNIKYWLKKLSDGVHQAGSEADYELALEIENMWKLNGIPTVKIERFKVLLSTLQNGTTNTVSYSGSQGGEKITLSSSNSSPKPYVLYSPNASVEGPLVYINYGRPSDYDKISTLNVSLKGAILIMKTGSIHSGNKVKLAIEHGALGVIFYPDPGSLGRYPEGLGLPEDGVIRDNLKLYPGDPLTPYLPSIDGMYRKKIQDADLPTIPVHTVSKQDAKQLLNLLDGPRCPDKWAFDPTSSCFVTSRANLIKVTLSTQNTLDERPVYNVIGTIPGHIEPNRYVILGAHHDSLFNGTVDSGIGTAILMELVRVFGTLYKNGWRPSRTVIFASWDAEEFGMIGSTEWAELHGSELSERALAYINLDTAITGNYTLQALGSPLLYQLLVDSTSEIIALEPGQTVYDIWSLRRPLHPNKPLSEPLFETLGSDGDFVPFQSYLGISSLQLQFVSKDAASDYPLYHSSYDSFEAYVTHIDKNFEVATTLSRVIGALVVKLSSLLHLPLQTQHYADHINRGLSQVLDRYKPIAEYMEDSFELLTKAVKEFSLASSHFDKKYKQVGQHDVLLTIQEFNDHIMELERSFIMPSEPLHGSFRHVILGPDPSNYNQGVLFPYLRGELDKWSKGQDTAMIHKELSFILLSLKSATGILMDDLITDANMAL